MAEKLPDDAQFLGDDVWYTKLFLDDGTWAGIHEYHKHPTTGKWDVGYVAFDIPGRTTKSKWAVESYDPLTLSPSILCNCGHHGFIRQGKWVSA